MGKKIEGPFQEKNLRSPEGTPEITPEVVGGGEIELPVPPEIEFPFPGELPKSQESPEAFESRMDEISQLTEQGNEPFSMIDLPHIRRRELEVVDSGKARELQEDVSDWRGRAE